MTRHNEFTPSDAQRWISAWRLYRALTRPRAFGPYLNRRVRASWANRAAGRMGRKR